MHDWCQCDQPHRDLDGPYKALLHHNAKDEESDRETHRQCCYQVKDLSPIEKLLMLVTTTQVPSQVLTSIAAGIFLGSISLLYCPLPWTIDFNEIMQYVVKANYISSGTRVWCAVVATYLSCNEEPIFNLPYFRQDCSCVDAHCEKTPCQDKTDNQCFQQHCAVTLRCVRRHKDSLTVQDT